MRSRLTVLITTVGLGALTGCTFTMAASDTKPEDAGAQSKTINASFTRSEPIENVCLDGGELGHVRFSTNPAYLLVSVVSLGLYVPQNVTWWCITEEPECEEGDTSEDCEVWVPPEGD